MEFEYTANMDDDFIIDNPNINEICNLSDLLHEIIKQFNYIVVIMPNIRMKEYDFAIQKNLFLVNETINPIRLRHIIDLIDNTLNAKEGVE